MAFRNVCKGLDDGSLRTTWRSRIRCHVQELRTFTPSGSQSISPEISHTYTGPPSQRSRPCRLRRVPRSRLQLQWERGAALQGCLSFQLGSSPCRLCIEELGQEVARKGRFLRICRVWGSQACRRDLLETLNMPSSNKVGACGPEFGLAPTLERPFRHTQISAGPSLWTLGRTGATPRSQRRVAS